MESHRPRILVSSVLMLCLILTSSVAAASDEVLAGRITIDTPSPREVTITVDEFKNVPPTTVVLTYRAAADVEPLYGTFESGSVLHTKDAIIVSPTDMPAVFKFSLTPSQAGKRDSTGLVDERDVASPSIARSTENGVESIHYRAGVALLSSRRHALSSTGEARPRSKVTTNACGATPTCGCQAGGWGSTSCSITISSHFSCSVTCPDGYYSCCGLGEEACGTSPGCHCYPYPDGCSGGGGGGGWLKSGD